MIWTMHKGIYKFVIMNCMRSIQTIHHALEYNDYTVIIIMMNVIDTIAVYYAREYFMLSLHFCISHSE